MYFHLYVSSLGMIAEEFSIFAILFHRTSFSFSYCMTSDMERGKFTRWNVNTTNVACTRIAPAIVSVAILSALLDGPFRSAHDYEHKSVFDMLTALQPLRLPPHGRVSFKLKAKSRFLAFEFVGTSNSPCNEKSNFCRRALVLRV